MIVSGIRILLSNFLMCVTYCAVLSALPIYQVSDLHATKSQVGVVVAAYNIASVLIRSFSGFTLDRFSRRIIFLLALVVSLLFVDYLVAITVVIIALFRFVLGLTWGVISTAALLNAASKAVDNVK